MLICLTETIFGFNGRGDSMFKPWMLAAMEDEGYTDTSDGCINRVAKYLANSPNDTIDTAEFRSACIACNVNPNSFTQNDLDKLQRKLNKLARER